MDLADGSWAHLPALGRVALALVIGLFVGIERERSGKEAGLRTFTFAALLGCVGGMLEDGFALLALGLLGVLIVLLTLETMRTGEGAEITTAAALLVIGFAGALVGRGHTFTPVVVGIATAGLLAWKKPLASFSKALSAAEFQSAVQLAILAFVVYPALPRGTVDRWDLVDARQAWLTVILIAALGFANYVLLKLYGARGIELTGFFGGLVNSTVTVAELSRRLRDSPDSFRGPALKGTALATAAMLVRNGLLLAFLSPQVFLACAVPLALMAAGTATARLWTWTAPAVVTPRAATAVDGTHALPSLDSPFSPTAALRLGALFLAIQIGGLLAQRQMGSLGFFAVSVVGGLFSSSSSVASAANLAKAGSASVDVAAAGALLACGASAIVNLPLAARLSRDPVFIRRVAIVLFVTLLLGIGGVWLGGIWLPRT